VIKICKIQYDVNPVDTVFNAINDLVDLYIIEDMPIAESQAINLAYVVIAGNPVLPQDMRA